MMVKIKKQLISNTNFKNGTSNPRKFITLHMTGNTSPGANAQAHANLQSNGNTRNASWHWQVDDIQAIQSFDHKFMLWHASDGQGSGNNESIAIEGCVNSDGNYNRMIDNYIDLVVHIMKTEKITSTNNVVTHKWWSGKNCPTQMFDGKNGWTYDAFIVEVNKRLGNQTVSKPAPKPKFKSVNTLANEVIAGKHGTGNARKQSLGNQYNAVQKKVNEILLGNKKTVKAKPKQKTTSQLVNEVMAGKHGNGVARQRSLGNRYNEVQKRINQMYS